jgi:hypothetical protein
MLFPKQPDSFAKFGAAKRLFSLGILFRSPRNRQKREKNRVGSEFRLQAAWTA